MTASYAEKMTFVWLVFLAVNIGHAAGVLPLWPVALGWVVLLPVETYNYIVRDDD